MNLQQPDPQSSDDPQGNGGESQQQVDQNRDRSESVDLSMVVRRTESFEKQSLEKPTSDSSEILIKRVVESTVSSISDADEEVEVDPVAERHSENDWAQLADRWGSEFQQLDPKSISADRVVFSIILFVVVLASSISSIVVAIANGFLELPSVLVMSGGGIVSFAVLMFLIFWPKLEYKNVRWRLDKLGFEMHKGIVWKYRTAVPLARIQHVDVSQGPIERLFKLGSITVYTAGSSHSAVRLSGLSHETAKELKDHILKSREAMHVL